mgnify:CR=1 FL=1
MTTNATFNAIINAPVTYKKKGADGKYIVITSTALEDNFAHVPSKCDDESAQTALTNLAHVYEYMEQMSTARTDNQRNKAFNKVSDFAKAYLRAVGLSDNMANIMSICSCFAAKRQTKTDRKTKEKTILGGYTTKSTFVKYALYLTNHVLNGGAWCDPKPSRKTNKSEMDELAEQMRKNKEAYEAEKAKNEQNETMVTFIMNMLTQEQIKAVQAQMAK